MAHLRFVTFISTPLLVALLFIWGVIAAANHVPPPHHSGVDYAVFSWLRIVVCAGALQCLLVPLIEQPSHLKLFLEKSGLAGSLGTLIVASIIFLPEVRRRLRQIIDARRAQGYSLSGLRGIRDLPTLLMPLVSSLLDSATKRAEFWSHRGVLERTQFKGSPYSYSTQPSALALVLTIATCALGYFG